MFSFLWTGGSSKQNLHLCRWDSIAKPKLVGSLGLHNIFLFKQALVTKSLWRVPSQDEIWHRVIYGKYITPLSFSSWLRHTDTCPAITSPIWRFLLKNLHIIQHWLCWKPGSGHAIHIGRDVILGLGYTNFLTPGLLNKLREKHIFFLFQATVTTGHGVYCTNWKNSSNLGLSGDMALEWQCYYSTLIGAGIHISV